MADETSRVNVTVDEADPHPRDVADLLDGIAGAFERAQLGLMQAQGGLGTPLDEL